MHELQCCLNIGDFIMLLSAAIELKHRKAETKKMVEVVTFKNIEIGAISSGRNSTTSNTMFRVHYPYKYHKQIYVKNM